MQLSGEQFFLFFLHCSLSLCCFRLLPTAPSGPPLNVMAQTTSRSVTFTWDLIPCIERNGQITGYSVSIWNSTTSNSTRVTENHYSTDNLQLLPFTEYHFSVAGVNSAGIGVSSNVTTKTNEDSKCNFRL